MAAVILKSGERIERESWEQIEEELQSRQFKDYNSSSEFRADMCEKALSFTGEELDDFGSSYDLMWEFSRAGWLNVSATTAARRA